MDRLKQLLLISALLLASCSQVKINDYADSTPTLDLKTFFDGDLKVYGLLQDRSGRISRTFTADIRAGWRGDTGTLDETFYFDDGSVEKRIWTLKDLGNGQVSGTAGDVVGEAKGQVQGGVMHWVYTLRVPYKDGTLDVILDDWLYLISEDRLLNKTQLRKFGFRVGDLTLMIEKLP